MRFDWLFLFIIFIYVVYLMLLHYISVQQYLNEIKIDEKDIESIYENIETLNSAQDIVIIKEYSNLTIKESGKITNYGSLTLTISKILENNTLIYVKMIWRRGRDSNPRPPGIQTP